MEKTIEEKDEEINDLKFDVIEKDKEIQRGIRSISRLETKVERLEKEKKEAQASAKEKDKVIKKLEKRISELQDLVAVSGKKGKKLLISDSNGKRIMNALREIGLDSFHYPESKRNVGV